MFHVTPRENLHAVLQNGLLPTIGPRSQRLKEPTAAVWLFVGAEALENALDNWLLDAFEEDEALVLLAVDVDGLADLRVTPRAAFEAGVFRRIDPARLTLLSDDLGGETDLVSLIRSKLGEPRGASAV